MFLTSLCRLVSLSAAGLIASAHASGQQQAWKVQLNPLSGNKCFDNDA